MAESNPCTPELAREDIGWKTQVTVITTWVPLLFIIAARVIRKSYRRLESPFGWDDYLMIFAVIPLSLGSIFHLLASHFGMGRHTVCLAMPALQQTLKFHYLGEGMNLCSIWIVKLSICFFLLRLIKRTHHVARALIRALAVINTLLNLVALLLWGIGKIPIQAWWNPELTPSFDVAGVEVAYDRGVFIANVVIDFMFAFSPIYFLWDVRISRKQKISLCGIMLLAILPSIAGVLKVVYIGDVVSVVDPTYKPVHVVDIVAIVEQNGGSFIANLPCLKVVFENMFATMSRSFKRRFGHPVARETLRDNSLQDGHQNGHEDVYLYQVAVGGGKTFDAEMENGNPGLPASRRTSLC